MNRFPGNKNTQTEMVSEIREVAPKIHNYDDYTREFLDLSERALTRGEMLRGASYLRSVLAAWNIGVFAQTYMAKI